MSDLPVNYVDDVLDTDVNTTRIYNIVDGDGNIVAENIKLVDQTTYTQNGTDFGAADINATNEAINQLNSNLTANNNQFTASYQNNKYGFTVDGEFYQIGGGGMPTLDFANPLHYFSTSSLLTYTATKDCYLCGSVFRASGQTAPTIHINDTQIATIIEGTSAFIPPLKIHSGDVIVIGSVQQRLGVYDVIE